VKFAAAYLRVSTQKQDWKLQRDAVTRAARARGDQIPKRLWFEEKKTGATIVRPVLQKLREAVRAGHVGRLYVFRLDRLTRSGIRDTLGLIEEFERGGAELVTIADSFDLTGPGRDLFISAMAWCAQMERNAIGERIKAARVRVEAAGGRWGRPRRIDPGTLDLARHMKKGDWTLREIAVSLKVPRSTLSDALANRGHYSRGQQRKASSPSSVGSKPPSAATRKRAKSTRARKVSSLAKSPGKPGSSARRSSAVRPRIKK
jgi:DNA invertase Pin-like site-specific DNA recombinase